MRLALLQVKEELGADAVIMSNKRVSGGVEIVAAVDGDTLDAAANVAPRQAYGQSRYNNQQPSNDQLSGQRQIQNDRVSLGGQQDLDKKSSGSMTKRFANMLRHYSEGAEEGEQSTEADSLSALLNRQAKQNKPSSQHSPNAGNRNRGSLASESGLSKLIADDSHVQPRKAQLDPTRFDKKQRRTEEKESQKELETMREEMNSIRRLLEHQVSGLMWQEVERREPLRAMLIKRLTRMGISSELADQLACYIPEETKPAQAWKALLNLLSDQINITRTDILKKGGVVALLGPTGVGKTTTVAKLAARAAMEYGPDEVALVTTDTYRIGAHEQLSIYGRIMGCPVRVAKDSEEMADVMYQLRNRRLILVDTAGMGQRDVRLSEQLDTLIQESGETISSYLVLPATAQRQVLQETIEHFRRIPLSGCILTKLDESLSLGEFISVAVQNALPVSYIANGQRVPEDIVIAQPKYLVAKANELLEKSTQDEPHFWNSDVEDY